MKLEVSRLTMLEAAKSVAKVAPTLSSKDMLKKILFESNSNTGEVYMTATNNEVSIQHKVIASVEESGSLLINPGLLVGMMSKLEGDSVSLSISPSQPEFLKVTGGRCTYRIFYQSAEKYPRPTIPFPEESVIMTGICSLAKRTTFLVSKDVSKPALQCVQVKLKNNTVHAAASDGTKMMFVKDSAEQADEREFLLPGRSLQVLASISSDSDVFDVGDIGRDVVFVRGDMIFTIHKLITGSFIDIAALVKSLKPAYTAVADVNKLKEAFNLISIAAVAGDVKEPVNLALTGGEIVLRCSNDYSEATSAAPANISKETPDTGFFYDVSALIKLFQVVSGKIVLEIDARGFMLIKTRNEVYLQSPLQGSMRASKPAMQTKGQSKEQVRAKGAGGMKESEETMVI